MKPKYLILTLTSCCLLAVAGAYFSSSYPDGLEWVAERLGFSERAEGDSNSFASTALGGITGILAVFAGIYLTGKVIGRAKQERSKKPQRTQRL